MVTLIQHLDKLDKVLNKCVVEYGYQACYTPETLDLLVKIDELMKLVEWLQNLAV